jgi:hypothetical protein
MAIVGKRALVAGALVTIMNIAAEVIAGPFGLPDLPIPGLPKIGGAPVSPPNPLQMLPGMGGQKAPAINIPTAIPSPKLPQLRAPQAPQIAPPKIPGRDIPGF